MKTKNQITSLKNENLESKENTTDAVRWILLKKLKNLFIEWILESTSHGLPNIFRTSQIYLKIFWLICFGTSVSFCVYLIYVSINAYLQYVVNINIMKITESPIPFPAITICNLNSFYQDRFGSFFNKISNKADILSQIKSGTAAITVLNNLLDKLKVEAYSNPIYENISKSFGFYIEDMLVSCSYNGITCNTSDFSYLHSFNYGNCYTFNNNYSSIKTVGNARIGLEIELYSGDPNSEFYSYKRGFYVVINNQSYTPLIENEGVYVSIGTETNIGIDRKFFSKQPSPYSNCVQNSSSNTSSSSELYQFILNVLNEKSYRQAFCYKLCYQIAIINNCSCYDETYPNTNKSLILTACHKPTELSCRDSAKTSFLKNGINSQCDAHCPLECYAVSYTKSIHTATYPTSKYVELLSAQSSFTLLFSNSSSLSPNFTSTVQNSVAKINVYYDNLAYEISSETIAVTLDAMFGSIGGFVGLLLGISVLSVFEIFEIVFECIRISYNQRKEN